MNENLSAWFNIDVGLRQGCVLSPLLFLIFINDLIKELKDSGIGVTVGKITLNNLVFADDIVLITNTGAKLQTLLTIAGKYA